MSRTDIIADFLTTVRNGSKIKKVHVDVPYSKIIEKILKIFKENQYIEDFKAIEFSVEKRVGSKYKLFRVYLKYLHGEPAIVNLRRVSRPGLRFYVNKDKIPLVLRGHGLAVISTSRGMLTDKEARAQKIGGEVICYIW
jgi:small subunit ribosomal protein S8